MESSVKGGPIPDYLCSSAFRILQESLTNVARHAKATHVAIRLRQTELLLTLEVTDNGIGLPPDRLEQTTSLGLIGMRERALACGGSVGITSAEGAGTTVLLIVPLAKGHLS